MPKFAHLAGSRGASQSADIGGDVVQPAVSFAIDVCSMAGCCVEMLLGS